MHCNWEHLHILAGSWESEQGKMRHTYCFGKYLGELRAWVVGDWGGRSMEKKDCSSVGTAQYSLL